MLHDGVFDKVADNIFDLMIKEKAELAGAYNDEGKVSLSISVKLEDRSGVPKITVGLKSKIKEVTSSVTSFYDPRQQNLPLADGSEEADE